MATSTLPVVLPAHWFAEDDWRGTLIHAADDKGRVLASVTVSAEVRGYLVGVQRVPASRGRAQRYMRRGWRGRLYRDALAALMAAWRSLLPGCLAPDAPPRAAGHGTGRETSLRLRQSRQE